MPREEATRDRQLEQAREAFRQGSAHFTAGRVHDAVVAFRRSIALHPADGSAHFNLGLALAHCGDFAEGIAALRRAERLAPGNPKVLGALFAAIADWVSRGGGAAFAPAPPDAQARAQAVSIVACSIDEAKLEALRANLARALGAREHQLVVIRDARALAEGYNRALAQCRHDGVVFMHDDVELVSGDPFAHLLGALQSCDVVGLMGSRLVTGPAVGWAGHPHLHGCVAHPAIGREGWHASAYSLETGLLHGMQALDGFLFAARREAALEVGFDAATFDAFHFYDLDFTYRAYTAGYKVAVTTDVLAIHQSRGHFGEAWQRGADRFVRKFPRLDGARGANHSYFGWVPDRESLLRFYGTLRQAANA